MSTTHQWKYERVNEDADGRFERAFIVNSHGQQVAELVFGKRTVVSVEADGKLIARAPAMLQALREARAYIDGDLESAELGAQMTELDAATLRARLAAIDAALKGAPSAAPSESVNAELLAALEALVGEADLGEVDLESEDAAKLENARAAIQRAKGGAK